MKLSTFFAVTSASSSLVLAHPIANASPAELYTVELEPGVTRQVTEEEKWALRREGTNFMDITNFPDLAAPILAKRAVTYPASVAQTTAVKTLLPKIDQSGMKATLTTLSGYFNRYYKSTYGAQSSQWLQTQIQAVVTASNVTGVTVKAFPHSWGQNSIIASIPGKSTKTIVVGAHLDSINLANPATGQAPGADDDGSGSVTILEALKVLLTSSTVATGQLANTIEFHWYSAEEGGLLGSQEIWQSYKTAGRNIVAMLQQDMTGYIQGTINAGRKVSIGVMMDYVDAGLTAFLKKVVAAYLIVPVAETQCGYACSDHGSAQKAGYPAAFVTEGLFQDFNHQTVHTANDKIQDLDFPYMAEHVKLAIGLLYELGSASL